MNAILKQALIAGFIAASALSVTAQTLSGATGNGSGSGWQSSWLDLKQNMSFKKDEVVRIKVEGTAENILVRFLPASSQPSSSDGIEGEVRKVPTNRTLDVKLV